MPDINIGIAKLALETEVMHLNFMKVNCPMNEIIIAETEEVIKSLEKQIPKKIQNTLCCKNVCPSCGMAVHKVLETEVYCQYCGQLIDWEGADTDARLD